MNEDKKTRKAPAFQLYTDDFLAGTIEMSQEEVGQFIRLLCHQWNRGSIPVETEKQQRLAGGCVSVDVLAKFDYCEDGLLRNNRLESVRTEKGKFLQSQSEKGKLSAEKRRLEALERQSQSNQNPTAVEPVLQPDSQPKFNSPSPSPSPNKKDTAAPKSPWDVGFGVELPESLRTDSCLQSVKLWLQYKSEKREGYKKTGLTASLTKWSNEFTPAEFPSCVENSIASGWKGIFRKSSNQPSLPMQVGSKSVLSTNIADYQ
jgi:uncharacterized protein YdaU (DUF1376 family)